MTISAIVLHQCVGKSAEIGETVGTPVADSKLQLLQQGVDEGFNIEGGEVVRSFA